MFKQDYYVEIQTIQNDVILDVFYDCDEEVYYNNIKKNENFTCRYFLIPDSNENIILTAINYDSDYISLISHDNYDLIFKPLKTGNTKVNIQTKFFHSASTLQLRIID